MTKITESSLELAAQCWCDEDTSSIEMNSRLAIAFAKRLDAKDEHISNLENLLKRIGQDLLMRAEVDIDGFKVVELSSSIWMNLKDVLEQCK